MAKLSLLIFSISAIILSGCAEKMPNFEDRSRYPVIEYPRYDTSKTMRIEATRQGKKICTSDGTFKNMTKRMVDMKYQIITLQSILDDYNTWAVKQNNKNKEAGFFGN